MATREFTVQERLSWLEAREKTLDREAELARQAENAANAYCARMEIELTRLIEENKRLRLIWDATGKALSTEILAASHRKVNPTHSIIAGARSAFIVLQPFIYEELLEFRARARKEARSNVIYHLNQMRQDVKKKGDKDMADAMLRLLRKLRRL